MSCNCIVKVLIENNVAAAMGPASYVYCYANGRWMSCRIFHAGPIIRPLGDDKFEMVSVGPTTSMRMEKFEKEFVEQTGVKVIVGKGGMGPNTEYACKNFKAIHCVFPAGNAVVAATEVEEIVRAEWRDLGMPET